MHFEIQSNEYANAFSTIMNELGTSPEMPENLKEPIKHKIEDPETFIDQLNRADNIPVDKNEDGELFRTDLSYPEDDIP